VLASVLRGVLVGAGVWLASLPFAQVGMAHPLWVLVFVLSGGAMLGSLGLMAGIWADKFDQLSAFQNFVIMPLTMLSGVFYSIHSLPAFWQGASHLNPFFFMIDGFRYGFFGVSDVSPWLSLCVVMLALMVFAGVCLEMLRRGYKLRH
jgi:ABC-2 type transport system permease protein